jgi:UDP-N-acetylmuramoylalanine--D-glutamate ligase
MKPLLRTKNVVIVGLGRSGLAAARLLSREGAKITGVDQRSRAELGEAVAFLEKLGATVRCGDFPEALLCAADLVVVSPGVPLQSPAIVSAKARGVEVWSEVELAGRFIDQSLCIGITGTNGKSTTTALVGEIFSRAGRRTFVGGNLGRPLSESALEPVPFDVQVIELSSFQLEAVHRFRLNGAAILNLTPDHLDRYPSIAEYAAAKARILINQRAGDFVVVNADDPRARELARSAKVPIHGFSLAETAARLTGLAGGAWGQGGSFRWLTGETFTVSNRALQGAHNLQNAMAASLLAGCSGIGPAEIQQGLDHFPGLAHRLEWVRTLEGVEWINDSKATNVDSTVVALQAIPGPIWLIAGGKGKGAPYLPLAQAGGAKLKGVLTIGQDAAKIEEDLGRRVTVHRCQTLKGAVERAQSLAAAGDTVLLSPACASYDQFKNFEDRGERFKILVGAL